MAMRTLLFSLLVTLAVAKVTGTGHHRHSHPPVPSPAAAPDGGDMAEPDCSALVMSMADCLPFVSNGSESDNPGAGCCEGLRTVLKTDAECLCEAFKSSAQLGVVLNVTKALTLPAACHVNAPPFSDCGLSLTPAGAPGGVATPPVARGGANAPSRGSAKTAPTRAPAQAPAKGSSASLRFPIGSTLLAMVAVTFFFS